MYDYLPISHVRAEADRRYGHALGYPGSSDTAPIRREYGQEITLRFRRIRGRRSSLWEALGVLLSRLGDRRTAMPPHPAEAGRAD